MPERHAPCRLVFLIRDLGHGGAQRQLVTLATALAQQKDFQVTVLNFYPGAFENALQTAGVKTLCLRKKHRWDLAGFFVRLIQTMRALKPDIIHGYLHESNLMALLLKPLCGFPRVVWGIRDSQTDADSWGILGKLSFRLNCLLSSKADCIIANSRAGRDYYIRQGYPADRFEVVPNGIDAGTFIPTSSALSGHTFTLIGRLHPMKDHATFLKALAEVPKARGRIIGSGDTAYSQAMQELATSLNLSDRVTWEPARNDLATLYPTLDCVVSTSAYGEGFSNVLGEAMACGVPCIASDVGDSAWLLDDSRWSFPAGEAQKLAEKMSDFVKLSPAERQALRQKNRQRILDHFTLQKMVEKTSLLLTENLNTSTASTQPHQDKNAAHKPSRILWITTGLGTGGAEMMLTQLISGLTNHSHTVISLTSGGKYVEPLRGAGVSVHSLEMPAGKPTLKALWRLLKLAHQAKPDVIMGWMYHGCLAAVLARLVIRARVVWNIRQSLYDLALEKRGSAMVIRMLAWLSRFPQTITYNSQVSAHQHESIGYAKRKTLLIPNGFDLSKWQPIQTPKAETTPQVTLGRFGRYTAMKDYPTFIEAAALIVQEIPQVQFLLVGTGVDESNSDITAQIQRLHLTNNVQLLGERQDLPALTASLDIAVSSSAFGEGFPNVVGEAMACGVPVVATDIGDTAWVMGDTGRIVPSKAPAALATACLEILRLTPSERQTLGLKGRERIQNHFSLHRVLTQFEEVFSKSQAETES